MFRFPRFVDISILFALSKYLFWNLFHPCHIILYVYQAALLEMSIENTNGLTLVPKKDYKQNRITSGMLQLAPCTSLVLDETALQQGTLDHKGEP